MSTNALYYNYNSMKLLCNILYIRIISLIFIYQTIIEIYVEFHNIIVIAFTLLTTRTVP